MALNSDANPAYAPLSILGSDNNAVFANVPTPQNGFSFTPGGIRIGAGGEVQTTGGLQFDLPMSTIQSFTNRALDFAAGNSNANRGFLGGVISGGQSSIDQSQQNMLEFGRGIIGSTEKLTSQSINAQRDIAQYQFRTTMFTNAWNTLGGSERMGTTPKVQGYQQPQQQQQGGGGIMGWLSGLFS